MSDEERPVVDPVPERAEEEQLPRVTEDGSQRPAPAPERTGPRRRSSPLGAFVEIIEPWTETTGGVGRSLDELPTVKPSVVRINGVDVGLVQNGSIVIDPGGRRDDVPMSVTLTLFPRSIVMRAE